MENYEEIRAHIECNQFDYFVGVPDSLLSVFFEEYNIQIASNEFIAYCMAIGAEMAGKKAAVFLQNSGFYYAIPALNGISKHYNIFPYLYITCPKGHSHIYNNNTIVPIANEVIDSSRYSLIYDNKTLPALDLKIGAPKVIDKAAPLIKSTYDSLKQEIKNFDEALIVTTAGYVNGWVEEQLSDRYPVVYLRGGMGGAIPIGIGLAQSTDKDVVVVTGDGAALMHLGVLPQLKDLNLKNLHVYVVVNGVYESTGSQTIPSLPLIDLPNVCYLEITENIPVAVKKGMTVYNYSELSRNILNFVNPTVTTKLAPLNEIELID